MSPIRLLFACSTTNSMYTSHYVQDAADLPDEEHYAVLISSYLAYPDPYEQADSGINTSLEYLQYLRFTDEAALNEWIVGNTGRVKFRVIRVQPLKYSITTSVSITKHK